MEGQDILTWRPQATSTSNTSTTGDEEIIPADVDEPPELQAKEFTKAPIRPKTDRAESLITRGLHITEPEIQKSEIHITTDLMRRRSLMSTASLASTAELTSDGGFTSPARTNTPSPPFPNTSYYSMGRKSAYPPPAPVVSHEVADPIIAVHAEILHVSPKAAPVVPLVAAPKKRCISFACGAQKDPAPKPTAIAVAKPLEPAAPIVEALRRKCTIKFACPSKPTEKHAEKPVEKAEITEKTSYSKLALADTPPARRRVSSRSPSTSRKPRPTPTSSLRPHRESTGTVRRASQSPVAIRCKPRYVIAGEKDLQSEAARFHEFCSEGLEEDDWIRKDEEVPKARITINDTLAKEIEIRRLGSEAEEEALEEDDDDEFDDGNDSDNEDGSDEEDDEDDETDRVYSDEDFTDGNETDNEAGFADSDDEDDTEGDFNFWTPGRLEQARFPIINTEISTYRASANRTASASSIESLNGEAPIRELSRGKRRPKKTHSIKIRPGTPDLPDSTDFVCGTLDEDRPLEDAYVSCMTARKYAKHIATPQDIDPSFPTSDPEDEEDEEDDAAKTIESDEHVWMQGKFEDSDSERRRSRSRKSPGHSPRRLHSPPPKQRLRSPPPKQRLRSPPPKKRLQSPPPKKRLQSPPPRKLFGNESPKRLRSPPPARAIHSPPGSPSGSGSRPIKFAPLGSRPGLTHTKSLPRTPNAFCRQYTANRIAAANEIAAKDDGDGPLRGAIDIVKGLEQKRQRRKEKFYQKHCANRARKAQPERRPQPGKGAERMRELGLLMAGKTGTNDPYMLSA
ncbi:uncharacterized protein EAE98_001786 [Botrytis deweyae]|uniref:Uncharacterized protein n=1 Tax=Botrytis deweyae TaxID=2478750 RepID=A0ABQ7IYV3_9HELO|nr:uncharacterized protein EAE98_001786 [Botrytis deweyae]KAF7937472.1 hypothetical protein EAE98_001786 [Botrytis deweyae]